MTDDLGGGAREAVVPLPFFAYLDLNILDYQAWGEVDL